MSNPFAGFLQPQFRTLEGAPSFGEIESIGRGRRQDAQRALENTQQNALAQRGAARADSQLKLQQDDQAHRFTAEEQKQVEGLLAEYQDAEDQGDQVRLSRASQMLKRFGMDVGQKNPQAFTGQRPKPLPGQLLPDVQAFTGERPQAEPIDEIVKTEMASREALKARNGQEAPDLSQEDFENQLINGSTPGPSRYEEGGKTTDEFKAMLPQSPDEPEDLGDVDDPAFKAASRAEGETTRLGPEQEAQFQAWAKRNQIADANDPRSKYDYRGYFIETGGAPHKRGDHFPDTYKQHGHETFSEESRYSSGPGDGGTWKGEQFQPGGVIDLDKEDPVPLQVGQLPKVATAEAPQVAASAQPLPRLPGQLLPTVISKGGKQLYESTGPSGRWAPMVSGVFEPFTQHENPEMAAAAKRAQAHAQQLIAVDGVAPKEAIKEGMLYLQGEANRISQLERTVIGSKPRYAGGVMGAAAPTMKDRKPFNDEMNRTYMQFKSEKLDEQFQGYNAGLGAISSANTASQYDALNRLIQSRSGLTVSDKERAIYDNLAGKWEGFVKQFNLLSGGQLPAQYRSQIKGLMSEARQEVIEEKERRAQAAANFYRAKTRGADPDSVEKDAAAVADAIRMGAGGGPPGAYADL